MSEATPKLSAEERARRYMQKVPPALEGNNGDDATYHAAKVLIVGFDLPQSVAWPILADWNVSCEPPWKEAELRRKLQQAESYKGKNSASVGKLLGMGYDEHERLRKEGGKSRGRRKRTYRPRMRSAASEPPASDDPAANPVEAGTASEQPVELPEFKPRVHPEVEHAAEEEASLSTVNDSNEMDHAARTAHETCPIVKIYGGKARLWQQIKKTLSATLRAERERLGRSANMPDTLRLDARVCGAMPEKIDVFAVVPDEREGVIEFDWKGKEK